MAYIDYIMSELYFWTKDATVGLKDMIVMWSFYVLKVSSRNQSSNRLYKSDGTQKFKKPLNMIKPKNDRMKPR